MEFGSDIFPESRQHCQEAKYYCKWCNVLLLKPKLMSPVETPHNVKSSKSSIFDSHWSSDACYQYFHLQFVRMQLPQDMGDIWSYWDRSFRAEKWGFHRCSVKTCRILGRKCSFLAENPFFLELVQIFCIIGNNFVYSEALCAGDHFFAQNSAFSYASPMKPHIFWLGRNWLIGS